MFSLFSRMAARLSPGAATVVLWCQSQSEIFPTASLLPCDLLRGAVYAAAFNFAKLSE
jgi:hypothetical protein